MKLSRVGVDLAKNVFQVHGARAVVSQAKHREDRLSRWVTAFAMS